MAFRNKTSRWIGAILRRYIGQALDWKLGFKESIDSWGILWNEKGKACLRGKLLSSNLDMFCWEIYEMCAFGSSELMRKFWADMARYETFLIYIFEKGMS